MAKAVEPVRPRLTRPTVVATTRPTARRKRRPTPLASALAVAEGGEQVFMTISCLLRRWWLILATA
jgi:hypothetical protein